jgi:hypothetical protein
MFSKFSSDLHNFCGVIKYEHDAPGMGLEPMGASKAHQLSSPIRNDLEADALYGD